MRSTWPAKWRSCLRCSRECDFHGVVVELVAIDQHHRPLTVRALDCVGRDHHISGGIVDVACSFELLVRGVDGLHPLFRDDLRRQILRRIAEHFIVLVDPQEIPEAAPFLSGRACNENSKLRLRPRSSCVPT